MPVKISKKSAVAEDHPQASSVSAIQYLQEQYAHCEGFVSVVAIAPDDGAITARSASPHDIEGLVEFVEAFNGKRNLFFSVNSLRTKLSKKAEKSDVHCLLYLHVDIDPRDGHPLDQERARIKARISGFPVPPSKVIDSGGGFQCFWRLAVPIAVTNNISELEGYNKRIAIWFDADNCWNIDRIMRLPGTWNLPTAKKKLQGRKEAVATVVRTSDSVYALSDFGFLSNDAAEAPSPSLPIEPEDIPDRFWELLKTDPKLKARWSGNSVGLKDPSRSGLDMSLAGVLWQYGFTKGEIAAILLVYPHGKGKESGSSYIAVTLSKLTEHEPAEAHEHCTDLGNARRLVNLHGHRTRHVHKFKRWLMWDGSRWVPDDDEAIMRLAKDTVRTIYAEAAHQHDSARRASLSKWATNSESAERLTKMVQLAKSETGIPISPDVLDRDPLLVGVLNGTIDLRTGALREPSPDDYITKQAPVAYDRSAECPRFLAFLDQIMAGNAELVHFLQRAVGYSLTGLTDEQSLFFLHGTGKNGKTTLINVIKTLLGDYGLQCPAETLMAKRNQGIPNDIARLHGARFVATTETDEGRRFAEATVKALTGGDVLVARFLNKEFFEFKPHFKIWLAANHKPMVRGDDFAIWRRIKLVPFAVTISEEKRDPQLAEKLISELPGILNWALQGCLSWQFGGLQEPDEVIAATQSYKEEMDNMQEWLDTCCITMANAKAKASELYCSYKNWASTTGEPVMRNMVFSQKLQGRGFARSKEAQGYVYKGIELLAGH